MKKTQKALVLVLCGLLCAAIISCGTGGGARADDGDLGPGVPYVATSVDAFNDASDGGTSTIAIEEIEIDGMVAYRITGNVTTSFQWGFVGWQFTPDEATLELLKTARAISFRHRGDGQRQTVKFRLSTIRDYAHYEFHFAGEPGEAEQTQVTIRPMRMFQQPSWGTPARFNQDRVEDVSFQSHESWRPGSFEITIWDLRVHQ